jgi:hypothetical protein
LGRATAVAKRAGHAIASLAMDDLLATTGAAFRALTMPSLGDKILRQVRPIKDHGAFYDILSPDLKLPTVATHDMAATAARLPLDDTLTDHEEVPLLGPEDEANDLAAVVRGHAEAGGRGGLIEQHRTVYSGARSIARGQAKAGATR